MKKAIIIISITSFILLMTYVIIKNSNPPLSQYVSITNQNEKKIDIKEEHKSKILVYYPINNSQLLNKEITNKINNYVTTFKNDIKDINVQLNQYYTLTITYDTYKYKEFISYVFYIESYTGGTHPNHDIWTISYNTKENKIITIDTLIETKKDILNIFSSISRNELLRNNKIVNSQMLMEGTTPIKENFSNFAFSKNGLLLFFKRYQVAPYSSGDFVVKIPYKELKIL